MIDLHAHILPGVDDGPAEVEESLEMCRVAAADGIHTIVATPHMFDGVYDVDRDEVLRGVTALNALCIAEGVPVDVLPGADTHVTVDLPDLVKNGAVVTLADRGRYLLLELPHDVVPEHLDKLLFDLRLAGIVAVITHPERHYSLQVDSAPLAEYVKAGHLVQVTACSLSGFFGEAAYASAAYLVESGLCQIISSDCHSIDGRPPVLSEARGIVKRLAGEEAARIIFDVNPDRVLKGEAIETVPAANRPLDGPDAEKRKGWFRRIWK